MNESYSNCHFTDYNIKSGLTKKRNLGAFVNGLIKQYRKKENAISYTFVSDEFLLEINQTHLQHNTYTDIITFDLSNETINYIFADIYISIDRVKENASLQKLPYKQELLRVILHGALHIAGFADKSKQEKEAMRQLENEWMEKYITQFE